MMTATTRGFAALLVTLVGAAPLCAGDPAISVENFESGERVTHPVVLLRGAAPIASGELVVTNTSSERDTKRLAASIEGGRFKALAELVPGENRLELQIGEKRTGLTLRYVPPTSNHVVRVVWMTDKDGDTTYQSQYVDDPQDYEAKLDTTLKLMQAFTADRMQRLGFGRRTFNLELDDQGRVRVHTLRGDHAAATYYAMAERGTWWGHVARWVEGAAPGRHCKYIVIPAYTRKDPETGKVGGHTALGGGHLALFGSAGTFSWPSHLAHAARTFTDSTAIDAARIHDDSAFRSTIWGLASTTIGAVLHELGHTFGLPHVSDPYGVMSRGFDRFNRAFTLHEAPSQVNRRRVAFNDDEVAHFAPVSAARLAASRWFKPARREWQRSDGPRVTAPSAQEIVVEAPHGLRYIGYRVGGVPVGYLDFKGEQPGPKRKVLDRRALEEKFDARTFDVVVVDDQDLSVDFEVTPEGRFVTAWHFSKITTPWNERSFMSVDARRLVKITRDALSSDVVRSGSGFVDFMRQTPGPTANVALYAVRTIRSERARRLVVHAGSDDALRVWLNLHLVHENPELRAAAPDQDQFEIELSPGNNVLVVEVSQAGGGWGLYLRLEDPGGQALRLDPKGRLKPLN